MTTLVQGNTGPDLYATLKSDGTPLDLTGCDVKLQMRKADDRRFTVNAPADVVDAAAGDVRYTWGTNDLAVPGTYLVQWQVTFPDAKVQTSDPPNALIVRRE